MKKKKLRSRDDLLFVLSHTVTCILLGKSKKELLKHLCPGDTPAEKALRVLLEEFI